MKYLILLIMVLSLIGCNSEENIKRGELKACEIGLACQGELNIFACCNDLCFGMNRDGRFACKIACIKITKGTSTIENYHMKYSKSPNGQNEF